MWSFEIAIGTKMRSVYMCACVSVLLPYYRLHYFIDGHLHLVPFSDFCIMKPLFIHCICVAEFIYCNDFRLLFSNIESMKKR